MTVNQAVAKRVANLLKARQITQYRLAKNAGMLHQTLDSIMQGKNKTVTFSTVIMLARGFGITLLEFLDDPLFYYDNIEID